MYGIILVNQASSETDDFICLAWIWVFLQNAPGIINNWLYPEHYFCRENTIFIGKVTRTAVFVGNVADRFDSYSVSGVFGGLENIVFLLYFAIEGILHMDQKEMIMVGINFHINFSAGGLCFYTCLDGILQQIGKHKAQINLI